MARRALGPATLALVQAVGAALGPSDTALIVACSGGADSLALAYAAAHVARGRRLDLTAVVVDHGLQVGSLEVAQQVVRQLAGFDLTAEIAPALVTRAGDGPEAAARDARYTALERAARPMDATVLLGHTADDQAESVLLGLVRGSGTRSLAGMARRSGRWLRPLLAVRRATTEQACAEAGLTPWVDPHNDDSRFTRVRVRRAVLPGLDVELGPGIVEALTRTADLARDDADLLDALAADADPGTDRLAVSELARLPAALRSRVLRRWLARHGATSLTRGHVEQVEALVSAWHGQGRIDLPGVGVRRRAGWLVVE